jgi:hypothetical protein
VNINPLRRFSTPSTCTLALLLLALSAEAQTIIDDFNGGTDSAWTRVNPLGTATYSFPAGNSYRIQAPSSPFPETTGTARAGTLRTDATFADFVITVDVLDWDNNPSTRQSLGILARVSDVGPGATDGYFFHYDPVGTNGNSSLWIETITDEVPSSIGQQLITALNPALGYRFEFTGVGDTLTGRVYLLSNLSTALHEIETMDSTYASGYAGLLVADQGVFNQSADATFDNFSATAVPEPGSSVFIAGAAAAVMAAFRRRRGPQVVPRA